jgi:hypothetical protein
MSVFALPHLVARFAGAALLLSAAGCSLEPTGLKPTSLACADLQCENAVDPAGVDVPRPSLGWQLQSARRGAAQSAFEVIVASSPEAAERGQGDLWDSGKVSSSVTAAVYAGAPLRSFQPVYWKVRSWDQSGTASAWSGRSSWTMGILRPQDWSAAWITDPEWLRQRREFLGFHSQDTAEMDTTKWVQLDLGQSRPIDAVTLEGLRIGAVEGLGFPRRFKLEISSDEQFTHPSVIADYTAADFPNRWIHHLPVPAQGAVGRYVRLTATRLRVEEGVACLAMSRIEVRSQGKAIDVGARVTASDSLETKPWSAASLVDGLGGKGANPLANTTLLLRREFAVKAGLRRALITVCGLGEYRLTLNGQPVGNGVMSPGWTTYEKTCLYDSFEVTTQLKAGANAAGLCLAGGMYDVEDGRYVKFVTATHPLTANATIRLEYADGSVESVVTDPQWRLTDGPITFSNVYGGEDYDARRERKGWDSAGFDDRGWRLAVAWAGPGGELRGLSCAAPPIKTFDTFNPIKTTEIRPGVTVYDLGQNAAMMLQLSVRGSAGAVVRILPSELLNPDGTVDQRSSGAGAWWQYTLAGGGEETWVPEFFYRGCRYLQVERTAAGGQRVGDNALHPLPEVASIQSRLVHSDSPPVGSFSCSNELFNRIYPLVRFAQMSNMMSVLTDCPHRERLGWLEQDHLNGPALRYNFGMERLYGKIEHDMADAQRGDGLVPEIAPEYLIFTGMFRDSPEWGSAAVQIPWQQYQWTGDREGLRRSADLMKHYVDYLSSQANGHLLDYGLGDWLDLRSRAPGAPLLTPNGLTATAFYCDDARIYSRVAALLGRSDEAWRYGELADQIQAAFNRKYYDATHRRYATGSQASDAIPYVMNLVAPENRAAVLDAIVQDFKERDGLTAGDVGFRFLIRALADGNRSGVVAAMLDRTDRPGYGYQLAHGATSLVETWNASPHSSQDHFMLGQINEWFYHDLVGIQIDPAVPGYGHFLIRPAVVANVTWAKGQYDSSHGPIACSWKRTDQTFELDVTVPANTTATVYVPATAAAAVREGGRPAAESEGVRFERMEGDRAVFTVGSGKYVFSVGGTRST